MNGVRRKVAFVVLISIVPGTIFLGGISSSASDFPRASPKIKSPTIVDLAQTADSITGVGETDFASSFGGVEFNPSGNGLIVHLIDPSASLESSLLKSAAIDPTMITFAKTDRTFDLLTALSNLVSNRFSSLPAEGIDVMSSGIGPGLTEVISIRGLTSATSGRIHMDFGPDVIVVEADSQGVLVDRTNDAAPWFGGDFLSGSGLSSGTEGCSAGFGVRWLSGGTTYLVTAGHCYGLGAQIRNGLDGTSIGGFGAIGTVANRTYGAGALDAELIQTNAGSRVWTGRTTTTSTLLVNQIGNPYPGMPFCVDGAYEGEHCGSTVYSVNG